VSDSVFTLHRGHRPLLVSVPHAGIEIPRDVAPAFLPRALATEDADWHLDRLYAFVRDAGASFIVPRVARYVIDLNRPPDNTPMYPGANNTELCPIRFFDGTPLYRDAHAPTGAEVARRRERYWAPYHAALAAEVARLRAEHGHAVLFDGHSIRAEIPWLFEGRLADLNLGTANGTSCDAGLRAGLATVLASSPDRTHVVDGRFKGGYITRHYGRPAEGVHTVQLEMVQALYMDERPPFAYDPVRAAHLAPLLGRLVETMLDWRPAG